MKIQKKQEIEFFGTKTGNANSIALGYATETKNFGEVAVGVMNKSTAAKDPNSSKGVCADPDATLFSVGCGGSGERKNALEVKGDGSVIIPGENGDINIADKIKQAFDTDASIELVKSTDSDLQYTLMVNNESRGSINIPKDQFLKNVTYDTEAKQLVFTFVTLDEEEHVERISINDLKDVYTAGNGINIDNNVISADFDYIAAVISNALSADFNSITQAISDEKTQRETTDNEIKSTLDSKADKTDMDNRLSDLQNRCFKFGPDQSIKSPYSVLNNFEMPIRLLNNNEEYLYADISLNLDPDQYKYIYDADNDIFVKITKTKRIVFDNRNDFFKTDKPLDLTHTFYLDNEKTGVVENLTQLAIVEDNTFKDLPYLESNARFEENVTPQYIYDANDHKWIKVIDICSLNWGYLSFNTETPLLQTSNLGYSQNPATESFWSSAEGTCAISLGMEATAAGDYTIALGPYSQAAGHSSIAIGNNSALRGDYSTMLGYNIDVNGDMSVALGYNISSAGKSIVVGNNINTTQEHSVVLGSDINNTAQYSINLGYGTRTVRKYAIALGKNVPNTKSIFGVGFNGVNGIDMDGDNYGLYLKGFGGYDGTNLVVKSGDTETLNPDIKSVQQIINEKANASAIPTKLSQLTNDANFITSYTETDPVWTREKTNYYTKTEIDGKGYLTAHQSLDGYAKKTEIPNVSTKADLVDGKLKAEQLPKLNNITAATTTEDMITKFNDLLADLKAKGYMTADITA